MTTKDQRPGPKPRKHPQLWQAYLYWDELVRMRTRHTNRIKAIEAGRSNLDLEFEQAIIETMRASISLDKLIAAAKREMVAFGSNVGPIWGWLTSIKGLGEGGLAAQLLAQIDDIERSPTISSLWRFAGWGCNEDGEIDRCQKGEKAPFNRRLKSICWQIVDQFIKQQTPGWVDFYYAEKVRLRQLYPEKIKVNGKWKYNDGHLHNRAIRRTAKEFLKELWQQWREYEDLPISLPYALAVLPFKTEIDA